jgi:hypothetical protein
MWFITKTWLNLLMYDVEKHPKIDKKKDYKKVVDVPLTSDIFY